MDTRVVAILLPSFLDLKASVTLVRKCLNNYILGGVNLVDHSTMVCSFTKQYAVLYSRYN